MTRFKVIVDITINENGKAIYQVEITGAKKEGYAILMKRMLEDLNRGQMVFSGEEKP